MAVWQQAAATIVSPAIASPAVAVAQATGQPASNVGESIPHYDRARASLCRPGTILRPALQYSTKVVISGARDFLVFGTYWNNEQKSSPRLCLSAVSGML